MCGAHATVRGFIGELVARGSQTHDVLVDMEAGLEHLSRGTGRHLSRFLVVVEPYYRSMETARRIAELAAGLGISDVKAITNKIRGDADRAAVNDFCQRHGLEIIGEVAYDAGLAEAERAGRPPLDFDPRSPTILEIQRIAETLLRA